MLELGRHDALLPLLDSRHRKCGGRDISWLGLQATERRSVKHATAAGIGFAHHDKLPLRRGHARVGIQLEETFISPGGNGHLPERRNPWWRPHHDNPNGSGETWLALGNDLKVIDAILDERNLRRDDLQSVRCLFDHHDWQAVLRVGEVNDITVADDVEVLAETTDDLVLGVHGL